VTVHVGDVKTKILENEENLLIVEVPPKPQLTSNESVKVVVTNYGSALMEGQIADRQPLYTYLVC
jgi:hypothetical protein